LKLARGLHKGLLGACAKPALRLVELSVAPSRGSGCSDKARTGLLSALVLPPRARAASRAVAGAPPTSHGPRASVESPPEPQQAAPDRPRCRPRKASKRCLTQATQNHRRGPSPELKPFCRSISRSRSVDRVLKSRASLRRLSQEPLFKKVKSQRHRLNLAFCKESSRGLNK
jgi:hypothetical protein